MLTLLLINDNQIQKKNIGKLFKMPFFDESTFFKDHQVYMNNTAQDLQIVC